MSNGVEPADEPQTAAIADYASQQWQDRVCAYALPRLKGMIKSGKIFSAAGPPPPHDHLRLTPGNNERSLAASEYETLAQESCVGGLQIYIRAVQDGKYDPSGRKPEAYFFQACLWAFYNEYRSWVRRLAEEPREIEVIEGGFARWSSPSFSPERLVEGRDRLIWALKNQPPSKAANSIKNDKIPRLAAAGYTHGEIAAQLDMSVSAVQKYLARCREYWQDLEGEE